MIVGVQRGSGHVWSQDSRRVDRGRAGWGSCGALTSDGWPVAAIITGPSCPGRHVAAVYIIRAVPGRSGSLGNQRPHKFHTAKEERAVIFFSSKLKMDPRERKGQRSLSYDPVAFQGPQRHCGPLANYCHQRGPGWEGNPGTSAGLDQTDPVSGPGHSLPSAVGMSCTNLWKTVRSSGLFGYSSFICHQLSMN